MKPKAAKKEFEKYAQETGLRIKQLNAQTGLHFMCAFYRHYRADDCPLEHDGNMLFLSGALTTSAAYRGSISQSLGSS